MRSPSTAIRVGQAVAAFLIAALLLAAYTASDHALQRIAFASGWALTLALVTWVVRSWWNVHRSESLRDWLAPQLGLGFIALVLFGVHVRFRIPSGWLDGMLAVLFGLLAASAGLGLLFHRSLRPREDETEAPAEGRSPEDLRRAHRWLLFTIPLSTSVVALALVHGVLEHSHGLLAHLMLGK